ncbi:NUDIX domain-containing protein [Roseibium hamelinense]|nr:NUDIX domain-containing protein [Roseibium hamelinense]
MAVSVFVFDGPLLLIQRRAIGKYHCGSQWANTCCSHPHWNEDHKICAERRLKEELGFTVPLTEQRVFEYSADVGSDLHEHEQVTMFTADVNRASLDIVPNPEEVSEIRWVGANDLRDEIARSPAHFTPWFRIYMDEFPDFSF